MDSEKIVVVGGGISGLYFQYKILKSKKNKQVLLIEKSEQVGGRIFTFKTKIGNINHSVEAGAGRFSSNHKLLIKLITEFNLQKKIIEIPSSVTFAPRKKKWKNNPICQKLPYYYLDIVLKKNKLTQNMRNITFNLWLNKNASTEIYQYIKDAYPYKDIFKLNAYDAIKLYEKDLNINNKFFVLAGGLQQLIDALKKKILELGGRIMVNTECKSIKELSNNQFLLSTNKQNIKCSYLVLAIQQPHLKKISYLKPIFPLIDSVTTAPLLRVYFFFDTSEGPVWFQNIGKTITDSRISFFIPINPQQGSVMISYTDENNAKFMIKLQQKDPDQFVNFILQECQHIFNISNIPKPIWWKTFYWEHGVGDWKPGYHSQQISQKITKPFSSKNLYICNENYSANYQCWIEGSLEMAEKCIKKVI